MSEAPRHFRILYGRHKGKVCPEVSITMDSLIVLEVRSEIEPVRSVLFPYHWWEVEEVVGGSHEAPVGV